MIRCRKYREIHFSVSFLSMARNTKQLLKKRTIVKVLILAMVLLALASGLAIPSCRPAQGIARGWSGVSVTDGVLFLGSMEGKLVAIDKTTQQRLWDLEFTQKQTGGFLGCSPGEQAVAIYGTPAVTAELAYISGYNGKMYAINAETGKKRWVYPREDELDPIVGGPVTAGDNVYFGGSDGILYALDAATGDELWTFESGGKIWGTPAVNGDTVYIGSFDKKLYAINVVDGTVKWEFTTEGAIVATPLVYDGTVYFGSFDRHLYALNEIDGKLRWKYQAGNWFWSRPLADNGIIYAGSVDGKMHALKAENGEKVVIFDLESPISSSPVLAAGSVVVAVEVGQVYSLDAGTKQKKSLIKLDEEIYAPLSADGSIIYIHSADDVLHAVNAISGAKQWSLELESE